jgi:hypothetical protein
MCELTPQQLRDERADIMAVLLRTSYIRRIVKEQADKYTLSPLYGHLLDCWGALEEIEATLNEADQRAADTCRELQQSITARTRMHEDAIRRIEQMKAHRGELEGQIIQMGAEAIRLRELLVQVVQEVNLADLSPDLRHALEALRESEEANNAD